MTANDTLSVTCTASGIPAPDVIFHPFLSQESYDITTDNVSSITTNIFTISSITPEYTGVYQCIANNSVTAAVIKEFNVTVQCKLNIYINDNNYYYYYSTDAPMIESSLVGVAINYTEQLSATLQCSFSGEPLPQVMWYYTHNSYLMNSNKYTITDAIDGNTVTSTLVVNDITVLDDGLYSCNASNAVGYTVSSDSITVTGTYVCVYITLL